MKNEPFAQPLLVKHRLILLIQVLVILATTVNSATGSDIPALPKIPVQDTVTMVDLGAKTCIPCKLMEPILAELKEEYKERAEIIFIDVKEDQSQAKRFGIRSIPTQIFYDKHGKEVYRHSGFLSKKKIKNWLDTLINRKE